MLYKPYTVIFSLALLAGGNTFSATDPNSPVHVDKPLFSSHDVLNLTLSVDFDAMCRPREVEDCQYTPTTLVYVADDGVDKVIPVEIQIRGGWRAQRKHCKVPPLFLRFSAADVEGTLFSGQGMLPLTTHCRSRKTMDIGAASSKEYEQYVLKEYLGYRLYNVLSDRSLQVRLARINYKNPGKKGKQITRYAFVTEHFDEMASRHDAKRLPKKSFDHEKIDLNAFDLVALYNFMIGNTDWSVVRQRNTVLIATEDGRQFPVPYDLDMSGLVDTEYSGVSPRLDFRDPKQRYYLGFCHPQTDFGVLFDQYQQKRDEILALPGDIPGFSRSSNKRSTAYLAKFFELLDSPERSQKAITGACHPWPPAPEDHTTPPDATGH